MSPFQNDLFAELSPAQRILLAELLWDTVAASPEAVPLSDAVRKELDARLSAEASGKITHETWTNVKQRLLRM